MIGVPINTIVSYLGKKIITSLWPSPGIMVSLRGIIWIPGGLVQGFQTQGHQPEMGIVYGVWWVETFKCWLRKLAPWSACGPQSFSVHLLAVALFVYRLCVVSLFASSGCWADVSSCFFLLLFLLFNLPCFFIVFLFLFTCAWLHPFFPASSSHDFDHHFLLVVFLMFFIIVQHVFLPFFTLFFPSSSLTVVFFIVYLCLSMFISSIWIPSKPKRVINLEL